MSPFLVTSERVDWHMRSIKMNNLWSGLVGFDLPLVLHGKGGEQGQYSVFVGLDWLKLFACPASASPGCQKVWSVLEGR